MQPIIPYVILIEHGAGLRGTEQPRREINSPRGSSCISVVVQSPEQHVQEAAYISEYRTNISIVTRATVFANKAATWLQRQPRGTLLMSSIGF
jgi:hypothetical protein